MNISAYRSPSDALDIIMSARHCIISLANEVGIDGVEFLANLPREGGLLKGGDVPVIHKKYKSTCSVILHINQSINGMYWPFIRFSTFKHGGKEACFNGLQWLKNNPSSQKNSLKPVVNTTLPLTNKIKLADNFIKATTQNKAKEDEKRATRFKMLSIQFKQGQALLSSDPWVAKRLAQFSTSVLLSRINVKRVEQSLLFPLIHPKHGHSGFHQIINKPDHDKKLHFAKQQGVFSGSYIGIAGNEHFQELPTVLCEGVATGLSIASVWPGEIRIALSANNLMPVRKLISKSVVFFCDEDIWKPNVGNVGRKAALKASTENDQVIGPRFHFMSLEQKPTDFNDLLRLEGIDALHKQIGKVLANVAS